MISTMCSVCFKDDNDAYRGLDILGVHICMECINKILDAKIESLEYERNKLAIRDIWINHIALNN